MNNGTTEPNNAFISPNAVSIYGQNDAMDEFPVLKAFQQYIDAEQTKAQKRMTTICIFFALILTIVIGVFVLLLMNVGQRNQILNDQLLDYIMRDRDRQPVVVQNGPSANDATVKMLTDSLASLQKQMSDQQMKFLEQQTKLMEKQSKVNDAPPAQSPSQSMALLAAEKAKLAKEAEELRKAKVEMHRRKLYPEYYAQKETKRAATSADAPKKRVASEELDEILGLTNETDDDSIRYFDDEDESPTMDAIKPPSEKKKQVTLPTGGSFQLENTDNPLLSGWEIPLD